MKRILKPACCVLFAAIPLISTGQVVVDMNTQENGIVTTIDENAMEEGFGARDAAFQWEENLNEFEHYDDRQLAETLLRKEKSQKRQLSSDYLPQIIDEDGIDLFLLTEDGINVYMAMDAPIYYQEIDAEVIKWIRYYAYQKRDYTSRMFRRYAAWESKIKDCFRLHGIPEEIAELCLVESGCTYEALSKAGALGMWQIMPNTGRNYDMVINEYVDQRKDPELSTGVAAKILRSNYKKINDWTLAIAAYNCGAGRVLGTIGKGSPEWGLIRPKLPNETKHYIPCLLAVHYVWTYRDKLGFKI